VQFAIQKSAAALVRKSLKLQPRRHQPLRLKSQLRKLLPRQKHPLKLRLKGPPPRLSQPRTHPKRPQPSRFGLVY
jgi:hypothetical protein